MQGFCLKFVSGPGLPKDVKPGEWLESWEISGGRITFTFGPRKTTRCRVNFFMNKFRKLGFIKYNDSIHVNKSLLSVVLHD